MAEDRLPRRLFWALLCCALLVRLLVLGVNLSHPNPVLLEPDSVSSHVQYQADRFRVPIIPLLAISLILGALGPRMGGKRVDPGRTAPPGINRKRIGAGS